MAVGAGPVSHSKSARRSWGPAQGRLTPSQHCPVFLLPIPSQLELLELVFQLALLIPLPPAITVHANLGQEYISLCRVVSELPASVCAFE